MDNSVKNYCETFQKWVKTMELSIEHSKMIIRHNEEIISMAHKENYLENEQLQSQLRDLNEAQEQHKQYLADNGL